MLTKGNDTYGDYFSVRLDSRGPQYGTPQVRSGQYTIVSKSSTATTATVKLDASTYADEFLVGDAIVVAGLGDAFDGTFTVKSVARTVKLVTNKVLTTNVATLTVGTNHGFVTGDTVTVAGVDSTFNGSYTVSNFTSTTISYARTAANVLSTAVSSVDAKATSAPQVSYDFNSPQSVVAPILDAGTLSQTFALARNVGDTWVDTSTTPSALYWWDGREWKSGVPTGTVIDDGVAPSAPTDLTATTSGYVDYKGPRARVELSWTAPTTNANAELTALADLAGYKVYYRYNTTDNWQLTDDKEPLDTQCTILGLTPARTVYFTVRAYDITNNLSDYATAISIVTGTAANAMNTPSAPVVTSRLSTFTIKWSGLDSTNAVPPSEFSYVEVHVSTTSGFTPDASTKIGALRSANELAVYVSPSGTANGTVFYFRLIAVDTSDNKTSAGAQTGFALARVSGPDLIANSVTANEINAGSVRTAVLVADSITGTMIQGDTITGDNILSSTSFVLDDGVSAESVRIGYGIYSGTAGVGLRFTDSFANFTGYLGTYGGGILSLGLETNSVEVSLWGDTFQQVQVWAEGGFYVECGLEAIGLYSPVIMGEGVWGDLYVKTADGISTVVSINTTSRDIGINSGSPTANALYVTGNIRYTGTITDVSSRRVKTNIEPYNFDSNALLSLQPVTYQLDSAKIDPEATGFGIEMIGFIAEEVDEAGLRHLVAYDDDDDATQPTGIDYSKLGVLLVPIVRQLRDEIAELRARMEE